MNDEDGWGYRVNNVPPMSIRQVVDAFNESCDTRVITTAPADGSCSAEGCTNPAVFTTVIGVPFCASHQSEFYSAGPMPKLKFGVMQLASVRD